jgi:hypothetical protein
MAWLFGAAGGAAVVVGARLALTPASAPPTSWSGWPATPPRRARLQLALAHGLRARHLTRAPRALHEEAREARA